MLMQIPRVGYVVLRPCWMASAYEQWYKVEPVAAIMKENKGSLRG